MIGYHYYAFYKPFGVLSQFSDEGEHPGLKNVLSVERDVYPLGRLDRDSEGLLLLTNDPAINHKLLNPAHSHCRRYWVQVEGEASIAQLEVLQQPMEIKVKKNRYTTRPCVARLLDPAPELPERNPPIRFRQSIPTSWIELELQEGKNRQVRKMTAQVGLPTLRLVRWSIEEISLEGMIPGQLVEMDRNEFYQKLKL